MYYERAVIVAVGADPCVCPAKCGNGKMEGVHTGPPLHHPPRPCLLVYCKLVPRLLVCCKPVCPAKCGNGKMKGGHTGPPLHYPPRPSSACLLVCLFACLLVCLFACLLVCCELVCLSACLLVCLFACLLVCLSLVCLSLVCCKLVCLSAVNLSAVNLSAVNLFVVDCTIKGDLSHRERPPFGRYLIMCWLSGCYRAVKIACLDAISR